MLKAAKSCFSDIVEVSGILIPREETFVRPERMGLKVAEVLADAGEIVTAGQTLARLALPEGGVALVQSPVAGPIRSSAVVGALASGKGEALFSIIARNEFDLVGLVPVRDISKLAVNQTARIKIIGSGEADGKVRRVASTIEPNSQLGQVVRQRVREPAALGECVGAGADQDRAKLRRVGAADRDPLQRRRHRGAGDPAAAGRNAAGRDRVMSAARSKSARGCQEGDIVVARAGALLREGDPVRPVTASADAAK